MEPPASLAVLSALVHGDPSCLHLEAATSFKQAMLQANTLKRTSKVQYPDDIPHLGILVVIVFVSLKQTSMMLLNQHQTVQPRAEPWSLEPVMCVSIAVLLLSGTPKVLGNDVGLRLLSRLLGNCIKNTQAQDDCMCPAHPQSQHNAFDIAKYRCLRPRSAGDSADTAFQAATSTDRLAPALCVEP